MCFVVHSCANTSTVERFSLWNLLDTLPSLKLHWNSAKELLLISPNSDTSKLYCHTGPVQVPKAKPTERQRNHILNSREDFPLIIITWHTNSGASLCLRSPLPCQGPAWAQSPPHHHPHQELHSTYSLYLGISIFDLFYDYDSSTVYSKSHAESQSIIWQPLSGSTGMFPRFWGKGSTSFIVSFSMSLGHTSFSWLHRKSEAIAVSEENFPFSCYINVLAYGAGEREQILREPTALANDPSLILGTHSDSQLPVAPVSKDLRLSFDLCRHMPICGTHKLI